MVSRMSDTKDGLRSRRPSRNWLRRVSAWWAILSRVENARKPQVAFIVWIVRKSSPATPRPWGTSRARPTPGPDARGSHDSRLRTRGPRPHLAFACPPRAPKTPVAARQRIRIAIPHAFWRPIPLVACLALLHRKVIGGWWAILYIFLSRIRG